MSTTNKNIPARRVTMLLVFVLTLAAYVIAPVLAIDWIQHPFLGAFVEQTGVVSQIEGSNWSARQAGLPGAAQITRIDDQPVANAAALRAIIQQKSIGDEIQIEYAEANGHTATLSNVRLQTFPAQDVLVDFLLPYLLGAGYLALGLWTYRARGETRAAQAFAVFCCGMALTLGLFFDMNTTQELVRVWTAAIPITGAAVVSLALLFPEQMPLVDRHPRLRLLPYAPSILIALYAEWVLYDAGDPRAYFIGWRFDYLAGAVGILVMVLTAIYRQRRSRTLLAQQQARIIVWGSIVAFGPLAFWTLQAAINLQVPFIAGVFFTPLIAFPAAIAYAIVRYRLLDVDRVLSLGLGYTVLTAVVVGGYLLIINLLSLVFRVELGGANPFAVGLFVFLLVIGLNPLRTRIQRVIDHIFFRDRVDYRQALESFSSELTGTLDLGTILAAMRKHLQATLHADRILVHLYDEESQSYFEVSDDEFEAPPIGAETPLAHWLAHENQVLYLMPNAPLPTELQPEGEQLAFLGTPVFVPLRSRDRLTGWLSLGNKLSGGPYQSDDLSFLTAFANQTAVALENARLFENVRRNLIAITAMKNLMDNVFASIPSGVITTDVNERITLFNRAAEAILGIPAESILGQPFTHVRPLRESLRSLIQAVIEKQMMLSEEIVSEIPPRGAVSLQMRVSPLRDNRAETLGVAIVVDDLTAQRRLEAVRDMFKRYVSPAVVDSLPSDPAQLQLGGQRRTVTVLFADLRGFTEFSEKLDPVELVDVLNRYLGIAAEQILAEDGTLDKFMGDAVMGLFNVPLAQPDHTLRAARAALAMRAILHDYRSTIPEHHHLHYGIGINVGEAVVGNIGTAQQVNYTAIGDCVNYAKRLQENAHGGQIILSQSAYEQIQSHVVASALDPLQVKGRSVSEIVYELIELK
jgi:PAS domain S-box-containing protein